MSIVDLINEPVLGPMLTAEATFLAGDIVSQLISDRRVDLNKLKYTATLAPLYGLGIEGLIQSGEVVGDYVSENPVVKAALGPNLFGNLFNTFFFVNNTVGENKDYSVSGLLRNYKDLFFGKENLVRRIKENYLDYIPGRQYLYSVVGTVTAWNAIQATNYGFVPEDSRTAVALAAGFVWTAILSAWSLKGRREVLEGLED